MVESVACSRFIVTTPELASSMLVQEKPAGNTHSLPSTLPGLNTPSAKRAASATAITSMAQP
jgi:hypothetical protein